MAALGTSSEALAVRRHFEEVRTCRCAWVRRVGAGKHACALKCVEMGRSCVSSMKSHTRISVASHTMHA
jgi:hypothetical protein